MGPDQPITDGNLYICDRDAGLVRRVSAEDGTIQTVAGSPNAVGHAHSACKSVDGIVESLRARRKGKHKRKQPPHSKIP
jgi:hypothetical protein